MNSDFGQYHQQIDSLHEKLDRLDEAIRGTPGNGNRPGILVRLDRLEQHANNQSRLMWLVIATVITVSASGTVAWIAG